MQKEDGKEGNGGKKERDGKKKNGRNERGKERSVESSALSSSFSRTLLVKGQERTTTKEKPVF